jgi:hypothetical protein
MSFQEPLQTVLTNPQKIEPFENPFTTALVTFGKIVEISEGFHRSTLKFVKKNYHDLQIKTARKPLSCHTKSTD